MSEFEARIKTKFGEIVIHFKDKLDLESKLSEVDAMAKTIEDRVGPLLQAVEKPLTGYEDIYALRSDGTVKLIIYPKQKSDIMKLVAFLSPRPLTATQLKEITGVTNPLAYMGHNFIANPDGTYSLKSDARSDVTDKIIPSLRKEKATSSR